MRGQRGKQNAGVDGELHLDPKSSLASSSSAPSVAGDMCDSVGAVRCAGLRPLCVFHARVLFFEDHAEEFEQYVLESRDFFFCRGAEPRLSVGVACGSLATSRVAGSKIRSGARPSPGPLLGDPGPLSSCSHSKSLSSACSNSRRISSGRGAGAVGAEPRRSASVSAKARKCGEGSFSALFDRRVSPCQRVARASDSVARLLSTQTRDTHAVMNSCGDHAIDAMRKLRNLGLGENLEDLRVRHHLHDLEQECP